MEKTFIRVIADAENNDPILVNATEISHVRRGFGCTMIFLRSGGVIESCENFEKIAERIEKLEGGRL